MNYTLIFPSFTFAIKKSNLFVISNDLLINNKKLFIKVYKNSYFLLKVEK